MTPTARLMATIELLESLATTPRPADALASAYFRARRYIGSGDRGAISTMFYEILRHHGRLSWWVDKKNAVQSVRMRTIAYLALVRAIPLNVVDEMFSGGKFAPVPLTDDERTFLNKLKGHTPEHPNMPPAIQVECPPWAAEILEPHFGTEFVREMGAMLAPAPLDLRVNDMKATRDDVLKALQNMGLKAEACALSPLGIRVEDRPSLATLPMLKDGTIEIQDEGSQLVSMLVDADAGMRVVDFCAGAGGKTLAIAVQMKNKGNIVACDVNTTRLKRSGERFRRAGLHNVEPRPLASERDPWVKKQKEKFDRVLVDAPCTGTGTWRRNPDARWRSLGPGLGNLIPLQAEILDSAARLVKKGGRLIYATCSMVPDENEGQIEKFLATHPDFTRMDYHSIWAKHAPDTPAPCNGESLALTPLRHNTDGFFAAVLERKKVEA